MNRMVRIWTNRGFESCDGVQHLKFLDGKEEIKPCDCSPQKPGVSPERAERSDSE